MKKSISVAILLILTSCSAPTNSISPELVTNASKNQVKNVLQSQSIDKFKSSGVIHIKDGKLTINIVNKAKFKTQAFNNSDVSTVKFEIKDSSGTVKDLGTLNYNNPDTNISVDVKTLTVGELYIVTMKAFYTNGDEMEGAEVKTAFKLVAGDQDVNLNYRTTPTSRILEAMIPDNKAIAKTINISELQTFIDNVIGVSGDAPNFVYSNIHPTKVNFQNISNDLITANGDVSALNSNDTSYTTNYQGNIKIKFEGLVSTDKVTVNINDPSSPEGSENGNSEVNLNDIPVGDWKTRFQYVSTNGTTYTTTTTFPLDTTVVKDNTTDLGTVTLVPATPNITSVTDTNGTSITSAQTGSSIKILGTNFHKVTAGNKIKFGSTNGTVTAVNSNGTELTVTAPSGISGTQNIKVSVGTSESSEFAFSLTEPPVIFVDASAASGGNGSSWTTAYNDLNTAISNATAGKEIWVAAGTYKPSSGSGREKTFSLKDGVKIYGGFAGTESSLNSRDFNVNQTILSGDLGTEFDTTDNAYHVVTGTTGGYLDGVTVSDGNANGSNEFSSGGGIYINNQTPTLKNLVITANGAGDTNSGGGAGMFVKNSTLSINNIVFQGNISTSGAQGGALLISDNANLDVTRCYFLTNEAGDGAAIAKINSTLTLTNSVLTNNQMATREGGGLYLDGSGTAGADIIINNTFYANGAGTPASENISMLNGVTVNLKNNLIPSGRILVNAGTTLNSSNNSLGSITSNGTVNNTDNINVSPSFISTFDFNGADNKFFTSDDGFNLKDTASAQLFDGGTITDAPSVDITNNTRPGSNRSSGKVTIGAFEK